VRGLDIGCGANLIYCLLGAAIYGWHMVGVDVTEVALAAAQQLVGLNPQLQGCLEVRRSICVAGADLTQVTPPSQQQQHHHHQQQQQQEGGVCGPLAGVLSGCEECFHFCMCNPPFFGSLAEANQNPHTACGGEDAGGGGGAGYVWDKPFCSSLEGGTPSCSS
jgi:23S rRNA (adenine1618-N6)-methyltransferase